MNALRLRSPSAVRFAAALAALALAALVPLETARAEDEEMNTSAYLVFDPETGEFVTVQDPSRSQHTPVDGPADGSADAAAAAVSMPLTAAAVAVVLVAGGAAFWLRRKRPGKG